MSKPIYRKIEYPLHKPEKEGTYTTDYGLTFWTGKAWVCQLKIIEPKWFLEPAPEVKGAEEVRKDRPMYMNREDAIETIYAQFKKDEGYVTTQKMCECLIDALIEAGHLTQHLPEGQRKPMSFEEWFKLNGKGERKGDLEMRLKYEGYLTNF